MQTIWQLDCRITTRFFSREHKVYGEYGGRVWGRVWGRGGVRSGREWGGIWVQGKGMG